MLSLYFFYLSTEQLLFGNVCQTSVLKSDSLIMRLCDDVTCDIRLHFILFIFYNIVINPLNELIVFGFRYFSNKEINGDYIYLLS